MSGRFAAEMGRRVFHKGGRLWLRACWNARTHRVKQGFSILSILPEQLPSDTSNRNGSFDRVIIWSLKPNRSAFLHAEVVPNIFEHGLLSKTGLIEIFRLMM